MGFLIALVILIAFMVLFRNKFLDSVTMRNLRPLVIFLAVVFIAVILMILVSLLK